jgi:hypothetical protein
VKLFYLLLFIGITTSAAAQSSKKINDVAFFATDSTLHVTIITDVQRILNGKLKDGEKLPAIFVSKAGQDREIMERITLETRGNFRKRYCHIPPLKVNFKGEEASSLSSLGSLKLVNSCKSGELYKEYLLKEYLIYKMYNLLTEKSFRVRLLKVLIRDSIGKKSIEEYAFLMEDVKDMAQRNDCVERKRRVRHTELTDREQMTKVAMFEYMIANLDWSVPVKHNIRLIVSKADTNAIPYPVPYDFDHSGFVFADYAVPPPEVNIESVRERNYRGFTRNMEEVQLAASEFLKQKEAIYRLIKEFEPLSLKARLEAIDFLDEFFKSLSMPNELKLQFILNARKVTEK